MQEKLLTIDQVAAYLKVDKFTVYRLVTKKSFPRVRWESVEVQAQDYRCVVGKEFQHTDDRQQGLI